MKVANSSWRSGRGGEVSDRKKIFFFSFLKHSKTQHVVATTTTTTTTTTNRIKSNLFADGSMLYHFTRHKG